MTWIGLGLFLMIVLAGAWGWGKLSDPRNGGTVGCCHCGQCIVSGECVMRRRLKEKGEKAARPKQEKTADR